MADKNQNKTDVKLHYQLLYSQTKEGSILLPSTNEQIPLGTYYNVRGVLEKSNCDFSKPFLHTWNSNRTLVLELLDSSYKDLLQRAEKDHNTNKLRQKPHFYELDPYGTIIKKKEKGTYHQILYGDTDDLDQSKSLREHTHQALKLHLPPCNSCKIN